MYLKSIHCLSIRIYSIAIKGVILLPCLPPSNSLVSHVYCIGLVTIGIVLRFQVRGK